VDDCLLTKVLQSLMNFSNKLQSTKHWTNTHTPYFEYGIHKPIRVRQTHILVAA